MTIADSDASAAAPLTVDEWAVLDWYCTGETGTAWLARAMARQGAAAGLALARAAIADRRAAYQAAADQRPGIVRQAEADAAFRAEMERREAAARDAGQDSGQA